MELKKTCEIKLIKLRGKSTVLMYTLQTRLNIQF